MDFLGSPLWQGIGVIATIILGFIGFYYAGKSRIWLYSSGVVVAFIVGFGVANFIYSTTNNNDSVAIAIDAQKDWQSTGIFLRRGDQVLINVIGGKWTTTRFVLSEADRSGFVTISKAAQVYVNGSLENSGSGGQGICDQPSCPVQQLQVGVLVGRIGNNWQPFRVGKSDTITAGIDGFLYLRINDSDKLDDNFGVLAVELRRQN